MDNPQESKTDFSKIRRCFCTMVFIGLIGVALTAVPVNFDTKRKLFVSAVVLADDDGNDSGDHGDSSGSNGSEGGDHDVDDDGDHDGDDNIDTDDDNDSSYDDVDDRDNDKSNDSKDSSASSKNEDKKSGNKRKKDTASGIFSVGGLKGLSPVSPKDEESLVGNWGNSSGKTGAKAPGSKSQ